MKQRQAPSNRAGYEPVLFGVLLGLSVIAKPAQAEPQAGSTARLSGESLTHGASYPAGQSLRIQTLPGSTLYPRYLADPRQPVMKAALLKVLHTETPETGSPLAEITMGGVAKLLRLHPTHHPELGLQVSADAAFLGRFDTTANYDAIGWDGYASLRFTYKPLQQLAFKLAAQHDSGHIADEYIKKTGRKRLTYTREEITLGAMLDFLKYFRVYSEGAYAFHLGDRELEPWRLQGGLEFNIGPFYAATDATLWQERNYRATSTSQIGLIAKQPATGRRYGIMLQFENGRSVLGEFYKDRNRTIGAGYWADL